MFLQQYYCERLCFTVLRKFVLVVLTLALHRCVLVPVLLSHNYCDSYLFKVLKLAN